jgi:hypothetical protein
MKLARTLMVLVLAGTAFAADVAGKWTSFFEGPDGKMEIVFDFKVDGGKITGSVTGPHGEMPITEGKVTGDEITFTVATDQFKAVHKGKIAGNEMKLSVDMGERTMEMTAKRAGANGQ